MSDCIGSMPAPHEYIALKISRWHGNEFHILYTARSSELLAAAVVTPYMEAKILNQRAGCKHDEKGRWFSVCHDPSRRYKNKRMLWESGEPVTLRYRVHEYEVLGLPGISEIWPNGLREEPDGRATNEDTDAQYWLDGCAATLQQQIGGSVLKHERAVGRFQRVVSWASIGEVLLLPDFVKLRARVNDARSSG